MTVQWQPHSLGYVCAWRVQLVWTTSAKAGKSPLTNKRVKTGMCMIARQCLWNTDYAVIASISIQHCWVNLHPCILTHRLTYWKKPAVWEQMHEHNAGMVKHQQIVKREPRQALQNSALLAAVVLTLTSVPTAAPRPLLASFASLAASAFSRLSSSFSRFSRSFVFRLAFA